jgi:TRAP-type C4-dicarboxylate transport system substrate-binding protein
MKKSIYCLLFAFLLVGLSFGINTSHAAGPIELKAVSYTASNHPFMDPMGHDWIKRINEGLKGQVRIKYVGGPEIIPSRGLGQAIRNNVVSVGLVPGTNWEKDAPAVISLSLTRLDPSKMRENGYYDFLNEIYANINLHFLGLFHFGQFWMFTKKPVEKLADLRGMKQRSNQHYVKFHQALGISPVFIAPPELYTALERGVVEGFIFPLRGPRMSGWTETTKYIIAHPFYRDDLAFIVNLDAWNKIPKSAQAKIEEITLEFENHMVDYIKQLDDEEFELLAKDGVKKVVFSPEEAKTFVETAYRVKWKEMEDYLPNEKDLVAKAKKLTGTPTD